MIEYIRRADALKAMDCGNLHKGIVDALQSLILDVPAADVRPVVRGEWVQSDMQEGWITCSICKKMKIDGRMALSPDLFEEWGLSFCPNCGADMRKEKGNADT